MFKKERGDEKNNSFKKPKENNRWKKMEHENTDDGFKSNDRFKSNDGFKSNDNRFKNKGYGRGRIHKSRYSKVAFESKMNNERGATQKNVSLTNNLMNNSRNSKKNEEKERRKERKKKKKIDNSFFEQQPKMNKSDKDFILNYYCEEQDSDDADADAGADAGAGAGAGADADAGAGADAAKKDIISF